MINMLKYDYVKGMYMNKKTILIKKKNSEKMHIAHKEQRLSNPTKNFKPRFSNDFNDSIIKLYKEGLSKTEIANTLGCSEQYVDDEIVRLYNGKTKGAFWVPTAYHRIYFK